jgi:hypothetical protein
MAIFCVIILVLAAIFKNPPEHAEAEIISATSE